MLEKIQKFTILNAFGGVNFFIFCLFTEINILLPLVSFPPLVRSLVVKWQKNLVLSDNNPRQAHGEETVGKILASHHQGTKEQRNGRILAFYRQKAWKRLNLFIDLCAHTCAQCMQVYNNEQRCFAFSKWLATVK